MSVLRWWCDVQCVWVIVWVPRWVCGGASAAALRGRLPERELHQEERPRPPPRPALRPSAAAVHPPVPGGGGWGRVGGQDGHGATDANSFQRCVCVGGGLDESSATHCARTHPQPWIAISTPTHEAIGRPRFRRAWRWSLDRFQSAWPRSKQCIPNTAAPESLKTLGRPNPFFDAPCFLLPLTQHPSSTPTNTQASHPGKPWPRRWRTR